MKKDDYTIVFKAKIEDLFSRLDKEEGKWSFLYFIILLVSGSILLFLLWLLIISDQLGKDSIMIGLGLILGFALLPVHELIHKWTFQIYGYHAVHIKYDLKNKILYTFVKDQKVDYKHYINVLICPFIALSLVIFIILYLFKLPLVLFLSILFVHLFTCRGDFQLISFMIKRMDQINGVSFHHGELHFLANN